MQISPRYHVIAVCSYIRVRNSRVRDCVPLHMPAYALRMSTIFLQRASPSQFDLYHIMHAVIYHLLPIIDPLRNESFGFHELLSENPVTCTRFSEDEILSLVRGQKSAP